ncbi:hypothetical protein POL68_09315 [Stigmatella sp. ncwal1]|uniref:Lipoprotein n=1 Tax=Stigmatella ashevillensis TaxID=2995309 RepID=A0ABT5D523_9BACT|nr:hypothetical protein [Stigmatella ashevillena]MDC0708666.1 hypothetical protein [Stigmatella ashevillena]
MRKTQWVGGMGLGMLLACASTQPSQQTAVAVAPQDPNLVCEESRVTGSHIPRRVCRTAQQSKEEREQAQKERREANRTQPDANF